MPPKSPVPEKSLRVLLVDDDPIMLELLTTTIKEQFSPAYVESYTSATEAWARLDAEPFDFLVTDLEMPELSGLHLLRCAKRRNAWTQVIVVTGHSVRDAILDAMDLGASDYLLKPLNPEALMHSLHEAAARLHRWRGSLAGTLDHHRPRPQTSTPADDCPLHVCPAEGTNGI